MILYKTKYIRKSLFDATIIFPRCCFEIDVMKKPKGAIFVDASDVFFSCECFLKKAYNKENIEQRTRALCDNLWDAHKEFIDICRMIVSSIPKSNSKIHKNMMWTSYIFPAKGLPNLKCPKNLLELVA